MATVAAQLGALLTTQADYNYYVQQQIYWTNMYDANSAKLQKQTKYEENWLNAFDSARDSDKKCSIGKTVWKEKDEVLNDAEASAYANAKVTQYNEELLLELSDLDIEYDTMKTIYDTLMQERQATKDSEKQLVSTSAQDTSLINQ